MEKGRCGTGILTAPETAGPACTLARLFDEIIIKRKSTMNFAITHVALLVPSRLQRNMQVICAGRCDAPADLMGLGKIAKLAHLHTSL